LPKLSLIGPILSSFDGSEERTLEEIVQFVAEKFGAEPDEVEKFIVGMAQQGIYLIHTGEGRYKRRKRDDFQDPIKTKGVVVKRQRNDPQMISPIEWSLLLLALALFMISGIEFKPGVNPLVIIPAGVLLALGLRILSRVVGSHLSRKSKPVSSLP